MGLKQIQDDPWIEADKKYGGQGQVVNGTVVSLTDYGAFIELEPGIEGLVHITEMSWTKRVKHPSKLVSIGDEVTAMVLDIDISQKRISSRHEADRAEPVDAAEQEVPGGHRHRGPDSEHHRLRCLRGASKRASTAWSTSPTSPGRGGTSIPRTCSRANLEVEAVVLNIDVENERFSLGIKQLNDDPWRAMPERLLEGNMVEQARALRIDREQALFELEPGIEGILPAEEWSKEGPADLTQVLTPGDIHDVTVYQVDSAQHIIYVSRARNQQ